jgi:cbb3-type cytochrome oxidase subunit 3
MKDAVLALFPHSALIVAGMLLFLAVFLGWTAWAFSRRRKDHFERLSNLPFED